MIEVIYTKKWTVSVIRLESSIMDDSIAFSQQMGFYFMGQNGITMHTLSRYESMLEKSFYRAFHELQRLQAMRLGHPVVLPIAIDSDLGNCENGFVT